MRSVSRVPLHANQDLGARPPLHTAAQQSPVDTEWLGRARREPHQLGFGPAGGGDDDLLAGRRSIKQFRETRLGGANTCVHEPSVVTRDYLGKLDR